MDWVISFLIVVVVTLLVGGSFATMGVRGPWPGLMWFFLILFFGTWALGAWVQPVGPRAWGVPWLTYLVVAIMIALLIAAATPRAVEARGYPPSPRERITADEEDEDDAAAAATAVGVFFWIALLMAATLFVLNLLFGRGV